MLGPSWVMGRRSDPSDPATRRRCRFPRRLEAPTRERPMRRLQNTEGPLLGCVAQTLVLPLAARALARRLFPGQGFADPTAEAVAARMDCDVAQFRADRDMLWGLVERSLLLDDLLRRFLSRFPAARVLSLGSGLSTQFERVDNGRLHWIDVDLPEVAELRRGLFRPHRRRRLVAVSVTETGWTAELGPLHGPTFILAEGLLMYLERAQVVRLARDLAAVLRGGPAEFTYDYYCAQMVGHAWLNPSLRRLGAEFKWGMARPAELSLGEPRWRLIDTYPVMERLGWPYDILWPSFRFFTGVRPYGIAHLRLARAGARSRQGSLRGARKNRQGRARRKASGQR